MKEAYATSLTGTLGAGGGHCDGIRVPGLQLPACTSHRRNVDLTDPSWVFLWRTSVQQLVGHLHIQLLAYCHTQSFVWALGFKLTFRVDVRLKHVGWWVVGFVADYSSHTRCPVVTRVNPDFWKLSKAGQSARVHLGLNELYFNVRQTDNVL